MPSSSIYSNKTIRMTSCLAQHTYSPRQVIGCRSEGRERCLRDLFQTGLEGRLPHKEEAFLYENLLRQFYDHAHKRNKQKEDIIIKITAKPPPLYIVTIKV